jgi:hypothetical protein
VTASPAFLLSGTSAVIRDAVKESFTVRDVDPVDLVETVREGLLAGQRASHFIDT